MATDVGSVREHNEDAGFVDARGRFAILADGMGGHSAGEVASAMAVASVRASLEAARADLDDFALRPTAAARRHVRDLVDRAVRRASAEIRERSHAEPDKHGMGTTIEVAIITGAEAFLAHVGDCRTYLIRGGQAAQLTTDHTVAETMRRAGVITDEQAHLSPLRSALASALGVAETFSIDHLSVPLQPGDRLLLCSDGLYDFFTPAEIATRIPPHGGLGALASLVEEARTRDGHDNITGIVMEVGYPSIDEFDEAPTNPVSLPPGADGPPPPFGDMGEDTLIGIVEQVLRESSTRT
jgi:serine/threonine protein phosphatase PrpC